MAIEGYPHACNHNLKTVCLDRLREIHSEEDQTLGSHLQDTTLANNYKKNLETTRKKLGSKKR
jgi:hypothetical protein